MDRQEGFGYPIKFAVTSAVISGFLMSVLWALFPGAMKLFGGGMPFEAVYMTVTFLVLSGIVSGTLGLLINSGVIHIFVYLLGGRDYQKTTEAISYSYAISALVGWIPVVNFFAGLYAIYVQARGLEEFHEMSFARALAAILLPVAIIFGLIIFAVVAFFWMGSMASGQMPLQ